MIAKLVALTIGILSASSACITVKQGPACEGGYCGVYYQKFIQTPARPPKDPTKLLFRRFDAHVPPGTEIVGYFEWAVNGFDVTSTGNCTEEIEGFFRNKAANLGYDGVVGVQQIDKRKVLSVTLTYEDGSKTQHPITGHGAGSDGAFAFCIGYPFVYKAAP